MNSELQEIAARLSALSRDLERVSLGLFRTSQSIRRQAVAAAMLARGSNAPSATGLATALYASAQACADAARAVDQAHTAGETFVRALTGNGSSTGVTPRAAPSSSADTGADATASDTGAADVVPGSSSTGVDSPPRHPVFSDTASLLASIVGLGMATIPGLGAAGVVTGALSDAFGVVADGTSALDAVRQADRFRLTDAGFGLALSAVAVAAAAAVPSLSVPLAAAAVAFDAAAFSEEQPLSKRIHDVIAG